jgi:hypothetical protein
LFQLAQRNIVSFNYQLYTLQELVSSSGSEMGVIGQTSLDSLESGRACMGTHFVRPTLVFLSHCYRTFLPTTSLHAEHAIVLESLCHRSLWGVCFMWQTTHSFGGEAQAAN